MSKKQLFALFLCNLIPFTVGNSLMSLLPIYISNELQAGTVTAGLTISIAFAVLVVSTSLSAPIGRRLKRYKDVITVSALICIPALWLSGTTGSAVILTILLSLEWFFGGLILAMAQVMTAMTARPDERGKIFGLLITAGPLSQILGGFAAGKIVTTWGYEGLFIYCALLYVLPILASRLLVDPQISAAEPVKKETAPAGSMPVILLLIMGASILGHIASFAISMTRSLAMDALQFEADAVTSTIAISGMITLALPFLAGWLSDRIGRQSVFIGAYILTASGAALYIFAHSLWHFWLAQGLVSVLGASMAVGSAFVTDIVTAKEADLGISRFATTPWIGAVIGSMGAGFIIRQFGTTATFGLATTLVMTALVILLGISLSHRAEPVRKAKVPTV